MRDTLRILAKDVRALRWELPLVLAVTAITQMVLHLTWLALPGFFAQSYLVARAIQQDPIPGDRQFWITRPISWKSLLAAKMLFIVLFVTVPSVVTDWAVLSAEHLAPGAHLGGLLWKAGTTTIGMITVAVLAAVTRNLAQFFIAGIVLIYVSLAAASLLMPIGGSIKLANWQSLDWARSILVTPLDAFLIVAALLWQYARRRTEAVRGMVLGSAALPVIIYLFNPCGQVIPLIYAATPRSSATPIRLVFDSRPPAPVMGATGYAPGINATVYVPFHIEGLPEDVEIAYDAEQLEIQSGDGRRWRSGWMPWIFPEQPREGNLAARKHAKVGVPLDRSVFQNLRYSPVTMRLCFAVTVFRDGDRMNLPATEGARLAIPDLGVCTYEGGRLNCRSPLRQPNERLAIRVVAGSLCPVPTWPVNQSTSPPFVDERTQFSNSPFPAEPQVLGSPVSVTSTLPIAHGNGQICAGTEFQLVVQHPVERIRLEVSASNLILDNYCSVLDR